LNVLDELARIARDAGDLAMDYFRHGETTTAAVQFKEGNSPVTVADKAADEFLRDRLTRLLPEAGWLSEESEDNDERLSKNRVFIVDPIDGTRAFMAGDPRWAVCVALVEAGEPVAGVVHLPALKATYVAASGRGATLNGAPLRGPGADVVDDCLIAGPPGLLRSLATAGLRFRTEPRIPSLAYRMARVSDGSIDAAIASTNARDWDIAAADIVLRESGVEIRDLAGRSAIYNQRDTRHGILLATSSRLHDPLAAGLRRAVAERA
jgi:myo-inositol-1(or 4)-monophosphatase